MTFKIHSYLTVKVTFPLLLSENHKNLKTITSGRPRVIRQTCRFHSNLVLQTYHICNHLSVLKRLLGAFAQSRKTPLSFFMSLCLSVFPYASARLLLNAFPQNLILGPCTKICQETSNLVKIPQNFGHFI
jgi:hypothetical protein